MSAVGVIPPFDEIEDHAARLDQPHPLAAHAEAAHDRLQAEPGAPEFNRLPTALC